MIDISVLGDQSLQRKLNGLLRDMQPKVVRSALGASLKRLKVQVMAAWAPHEQTGRLTDAMDATPVRTRTRKRTGMVSAHWRLPTRVLLGVPPEYKWYYPHAVEYGYTRLKRAPVVVPGKAITRSRVNRETPGELERIARDIDRGIDRRMRRVA